MAGRWVHNLINPDKYKKKYCGVEQLVARWAHNPKVVGSSPAPATQNAWQLCRAFLFKAVGMLIPKGR